MTRKEVGGGFGILIVIFFSTCTATAQAFPRTTQAAKTSSSTPKPSAASTPKPTTKPTPLATPKGTPKPLDKTAVKAALIKGNGYATSLFNEAKAALGTYQYSDANSGLIALNDDPNSPASKWNAFNKDADSKNASASMQSQAAYNDAANSYYAANLTYPTQLDDWDNILTQTYSDISKWTHDATSWQIHAISDQLFNADSQAVQKDFTQLQADINKL